MEEASGDEQQGMLDNNQQRLPSMAQRLQQLRKSRNFVHQLRKMLNERNTALISAICTEFSRDEIVDFLRLAIKKNSDADVKRPWASCFISIIKEWLREKGEQERCRKLFGKTSQQKRKKDSNRRIRRQLEKRGIEVVGRQGNLQAALQQQIQAIQRQKDT